MKMRMKIVSTFGLLIIAVLLVAGFASVMVTRSSIEQKFQEDILFRHKLTQDIVKNSMVGSLRSQLKTTVDKTASQVETLYKQGKEKKYEKDARQRALSLFQGQKIGSSGYMFVMDSSGYYLSHPDKAKLGIDFKKEDFVQKILAGKSGLLFLNEKLNTDSADKPAAVYLDYFSEWDWIIGAVLYQDEFNQFVDLESFKKMLGALKDGDRGFPFIYDGKGNMVYHPALEGQNVLETKDSAGNPIYKDILAKKEGGALTAWFKTAGSDAAVEKQIQFALFVELDWAICYQSSREEAVKEVRSFRNFIIGMLLLLFLISAFVLFGGSFLFTKLLGDVAFLIRNAVKPDGSYGKIEMQTKDEVADIVEAVNELAEKLKK